MELNRRRLGAGFVRARVAVIILLLVAGIGVSLRFDAHSKRPLVSSRTTPANSSLANLRKHLAYAHSPLMFEPNVGQTDPSVKFLARGSNYALFLTEKQAVLALHSPARANSSSSKQENSNVKTSTIRMSLVGANPSADVLGTDQLESRSNYFIGNDPSRWHTGVPHYARVRYQAVYPGIDLIYYGREGQLEYDFQIAPGADPKQVALQFDGSDRLDLSPSGDLVLSTANGNVRLQAPRVYQRFGQEIRPVAAKFALSTVALSGNAKSSQQVSFELADYDRTRELVIDPILTYSTYLGGSGEESCSTITGNTVMPGLGLTIPGTPNCPAIATDIGGNIYVAGSTTSPSNTFPGNPVGGTLTGTANVFVAEFNSTGQALAVTYLGGTDTSEIDYPSGIAVDSGLNIIVAGTTNSGTFPVSGAPFQASPGASGTNHVFVSEFAQGSIGAQVTTPNLKYSTYLFGNGTDLASGVAVDSLGNIYVAGTTTSTNFPITSGTALPFTPPGSNEFFFSKLNPKLNGAPGLLYSTYIGGTTVPASTTPVAIGGGIAVDTNCNAYVAGGTNYTNMPVLNAYQSLPNAFNGGVDAWLGEFKVPLGSTCSSPNASNYVQNYLTYFGGTGVDVAYGIAVDTGFNAYITGGTNSSDIAGGSIVGVQPIIGCTQVVANNTCPVPEGFIAKFAQPVTTGTTPGLVTLAYSSYLGGAATPDFGLTVGLAIAADNSSDALVTGLTSTTDLNLIGTNTFQPAYGGGAYDAFFAHIDTATGTCVVNTTCPSYTSYLGGSGTDIGTGVTLDNQQSVYLTGETASANFPTASPFQSTLNGSSDAFVTKLGSTVSLPTTITKTPNPSPVGIGNAITFTYTVTNDGDQTNGVVFTDHLATGANFVSATASPGGTCPTPQNSTSAVTCSIGTLTAGEVATVTIIVTPTIAGSITNSGGVTQPAVENTATQPSVTVSDYSLAALAPTSQTVPAGVPAIFNLQVTPTGPIPETVTLACGTVPTGVTCTFNGGSIPNLNSGPVSRTLELTTTARVTTTTHLLQNGGPLFAIFLPISGLTLVGMGVRRKKSRKGYWLAGIALSAFFGLVLFQAGCSGSSSTTTTTGTPAGTYTIVINATSGTVTRSTTVQLIEQ